MPSKPRNESLREFLSLRSKVIEPVVAEVCQVLNRQGHMTHVIPLEALIENGDQLRPAGFILSVDTAAGDDWSRFEITYDCLHKVIDINATEHSTLRPLKHGLSLADISRKVLKADILSWLGRALPQSRFEETP